MIRGGTRDRWSGLAILALSIMVVPPLVGATGPASAQEARLPYSGEPAPAQLQVLAPLAGSWKLEIVVRSAAEPGKETRITGSALGQWMLNGKFLRLDGRTSDGSVREEYTVLYAYDVAKSLYRRWYFSSIGLTSEAEGRWNEPEKKMTWTLLHAGENRSGILVDSLGRDTVTTDVVYKDGSGKVVRSVAIRAVRAPSAEKP